MWAQYRIILKNAPNPDERELLSWLVKQARAWSQERGLALFLLINRFSPDWKDQLNCLLQPIICVTCWLSGRFGNHRKNYLREVAPKNN
jgi:hypothetical protein